jgi:hypothetical protein
MRFACGLVFALCLASAHSAEKAALDFEFSRAVEEGKVTVKEMVRRLEAAVPKFAKPGEEPGIVFAEIYAAAIKKARGAEWEKLEGLLRAIPVDSFDFDECFSAYATARIRRQVAELARKPVHLEFKPVAEGLPKQLADAPASLQEAWKVHRSVIAPYLAIVAPPGKEDEPPKKLPALGVDLQRVVGKPEAEAWKHLGAHEWIGGCGAGREMLYHPRNRALLLSFLADGKLQEAAGAVLAQAPSPMGRKDDFESVAVDLLTALGLDWEQVALGSVLPVTAFNMANRRPFVSSSFVEFDPWRLLAARGSGRAIQQCLDLVRWARPDTRDAGQFLAAALGPKPVRTDVLGFPTNSESPRSLALPREIRGEVLSVFAEYLAPANSPTDLVDVMREVPKHCVKDLRKPLAALLSHRVHPVSAKALDLLREAGLTNGQEKIVAAPPPLRFRMLLNGKPLSDEKASLIAIAKRAPGGKGQQSIPLDAYVTIVSESESADAESPFSRAVASSQDLTTDAKGEVSYSLEECVEPERIASVHVHMGPSLYSSESDDQMPSIVPEEKPKQPDNEWPGPWIVHQINAVAGDERVTEIELRAADLEVRLAAFDELPRTTPVRIMLRRANGRDPFSPERGVAKITAKVGSSVFFRRLQPGKYTLSVKAAGAAVYDSGEIAVGDAAIVHDVKLEPGRNVRGTAVYPDGTKLSLTYPARLLRDGIEVPRNGIDEWEGLAYGKYTAHILSTREWEEEAKKAGQPASKIAEEDRIDAREVSFVIDASTPATLDLGEIVLSRERR